MFSDYSFVFDIDVNTSMKRVGAEKDRLESAGIEFHNRVRSGYLKLAQQEPERIKVIDATESVEQIHNQVTKIFNSYITQLLSSQEKLNSEVKNN